ncbi:MAG TPA: universal stress protein [Roseiarcus sp.]|nr:universal stress protein [Roseiarcus sp.]
MIKTILVALNGDKRDLGVIATARALASLVEAHLDFYHVSVTPDQFAAHAPHIDFAEGRGLKEALDGLERDRETRSAAARRRADEFSARAGEAVSASWVEQSGDFARAFAFQARHHDLVVVGRPPEDERFRRDLIDQILLSSGRAIVIAPVAVREAPISVVMVGWKETPEAARAFAAAMPILVKARRVVLTHVADHDPDEGLNVLARHLAGHGVAAETQMIEPGGRSVAQALHAAAETVHADLLVVGAYGHSRIRELVFGGVTRSLLAGAGMPVLLSH